MRKLRPWIVALAASLVVFVFAYSGAFYRINMALTDALFQSPHATDGQVLVIGIDSYALEELGPFQSWSREIFAQAIEELNKDPDHKPAAIGLDVLFVGETDEEADARLARACADGGNVVTGAVANFADELVINEDGTFYMDDYSIESVDYPYDALREVSEQGHINAMYDSDGILRHAILHLQTPDGAHLDSFSWKLYEMYAKAMGLSKNEIPPVDSKGRFYVSYCGLPGSYYEGYSVADLVRGEVPSEVFEDRIVLIGPYTAGLSDYVLTSIDHAGLMYGVEFQANVIDSLIEGDYKKEARTLWQCVLLAAVTFAGMIGFRGRKMWIMTLVWGVWTVGYIGFIWLAYQTGFVLDVLWIPAASTGVYIYWVAVNYIHAAVEKRRVTGMFKRYVAPEIVNEILKSGTEGLELGGRMTEIAVLFVDIRGFTTLSEQLPADQVVEILNRYLTLTSRCVIQNKGTLDKFVGDCTMAIWGAPLSQDDYIYLAAKAAVDMREGSRALSQEIEKRYGKPLGFGIGIHCGQAVVGNIGAPDRMDFTAIGDTVNTASRLESSAPGGTIYISKAVADALSGRIRTSKPTREIRLKGKSEEIEILVLEELL